MKLFRVEQLGEAQCFRVATGPTGVQCFVVDEGNSLMVIDMIVDMGERELKFSNGPETIERPAERALSPRARELLIGQD